MEAKPQQQQKTDKTTPDSIDEGGGECERDTSLNSERGGEGKAEDRKSDDKEKLADNSDKGEKVKKDDGSGGSAPDCGSPSSSGNPGPSSGSKDSVDPSGKEKEGFPSLFISHASINISGSNPDISESEKLKNRESGREGGTGKTDFGIPQRVVVHRVCSDSRIGEGEGFHSSRLLALYNPDGSLSSSLKALGLSVNSGGSRSNSIKGRNKQKHLGGNYNTSERGQSSSSNKETGNDNGPVSSGHSGSIKSRSQGLNLGLEPRAGGGVESGGVRESGNGNGAGRNLEVLPAIEQSLSESKAEHPSTSEGEETITEDVVEDDDVGELLDEYDDDPNENLDSQLDFDAAVTELLLRPEKSRYKDSATWTQEDDMPSPLSDISPVASPRRKKERNIYRDLEEEDSGTPAAAGHSHNSLLEQYHQYLLEQQQQQQPQVHRHSRGGSGSKSGGSGSHHHHHSHSHHSHSHHKSSIVGIHQGNLKSQSHSHSHHYNPPLPPPPPPQHAECFTVSSQLLSREAKLYENVPATQGELETLEILLASGGSGDSNYPPSGGSGSGGGASNTTASTSNTSGTSGQSHHKNSNLNSNNNDHHHHRGHHHNHQLLHQGYVHGQHSHSATNLNTANTANSAEQLFSVSDFLGPGGGLTVNNNGGPPSRTSWADSGRESLSFDGENNNSTGSTRNLLLIPPPPPPPINYLASTSAAVGSHSTFANSGSHGTSSMMHSSHHGQHHKSSSHHSHHRSHHHTHSQVQSSDSPSHHNTKRSRRERLVRQKHAINDETIFPTSQHGDKMGTGMLGDPGMSSGFMAVPSPRRGIIPGSMQATNFVTAAASPINLQRHPPASQIMLQENKKNGPLIPCESPYGIMAGGTGPIGQIEWPYPETFGDNYRRATNKPHLTSNILRSRSPHRGLGDGGGGGRKGKNNSSFDYGELPSHQMFPKRHLLQTRQFSGHRGYSPGGSGTMQNNGNGGAPQAFQPMQHRSFPAGVFSGTTPRSCSMGDLTSSAASLNGGPNTQGHHHHGGKSPERMGISTNTAPVNGLQSSTVPLVTSLPLPPATSVTYEFSLAPVSGTLAPGWHLTAVQRGLATAVPLAAAVARRRLPRPRTARPRFGFTDKNEARRAKWTIVITALALLAMSMLLVGITLRLAPLIDDLGSTSSSGSVRNRISFCRDPLSRRASGDALSPSETSASYGALPLKRKLLGDCSDPGMDRNGYNLVQSELSSFPSSAAGSGQNLNISLVPHPLEKKIGVARAGSNKSRDGEVDTSIKRQISMTLSIPSREDSVRSHNSIKSYGSYSAAAAAPIAAVTLASFCTGSKLHDRRIVKQSSFGKLGRCGSNPDVFSSRHSDKWREREQELFQANNGKAKFKALFVDTEPASNGSSSHIPSNATLSNVKRERKKKKDVPKEQKRNEKVALAVHLIFCFLLILAITCIVVFLRVSSYYNPTASPPTLPVRKENENLLQSIQPQLNLANATTPQPSTHTQDNSGSDSGIDNSDKSIASLQSGQSLTLSNHLSSSLLSSSSNIEDEEGSRGKDPLPQPSNNETTHELLEISTRDEKGAEETGSSSRSNNNQSSSNILINNDSLSNPSVKTNSARPKRSRPRRKLEEGEQPQRTSNIIISVLNEKSHANHAPNDEPPPTKTRHLESTLIRFLKNSSQGLRERRNLVEGSRKL